jgi:hypothetical protein
MINPDEDPLLPFAFLFARLGERIFDDATIVPAKLRRRLLMVLQRYVRLAAGQPEDGDRFGLLRAIVSLGDHRFDLIRLMGEVARDDDNATFPWKLSLQKRRENLAMWRRARTQKRLRGEMQLSRPDRVVGMVQHALQNGSAVSLNEAYRIVADKLEKDDSSIRKAYQKGLASAKLMGFSWIFEEVHLPNGGVRRRKFKVPFTTKTGRPGRPRKQGI